MAKQELLIAKGDAVPMLLEALENPEFAEGRAELAEVLVGLMTRVDDGRIDSSLKAHLVSDPDSETRARIAREIGILKRPDFADSFVRAVDDEDGQVRGEALTALCLIREELEPELLIGLSEKARLLQSDENDDVRLGALIIVADRVDLWLTEAENEALKGRLAAAESLYHEALAYAPDSKKTNLKLGHYLFENGQEDRGLQLLRDSGWLLDVPVFERPPLLDGRLDDEVWSWAGKFGPFFTWSGHNIAVPSKVHTEMYAGYTRDALYLAARCMDAYPESLRVSSSERDHDEYWLEDVVEFFFDANLDLNSALIATINSTGAIIDKRAISPFNHNSDISVDLKSQAAAYVGDDFWSIEYKLEFGQPDVLRPASGVIWGVAAQRGFRSADEWSQWTPGFSDMTAPESFGWFRFK